MDEKPDRGRRTPEQYARLCRAMRMRDRGASFQEIGAALGISRQAASQLLKAYHRVSIGLPRKPTTNPSAHHTG